MHTTDSTYAKKERAWYNFLCLVECVPSVSSTAGPDATNRYYETMSRESAYHHS